jgi:hypothetical protein
MKKIPVLIFTAEFAEYAEIIFFYSTNLCVSACSAVNKGLKIAQSAIHWTLEDLTSYGRKNQFHDSYIRSIYLVRSCTNANANANAVAA